MRWVDDARCRTGLMKQTSACCFSSTTSVESLAGCHGTLAHTARPRFGNSRALRLLSGGHVTCSRLARSAARPRGGNYSTLLTREPCAAVASSSACAICQMPAASPRGRAVATADHRPLLSPVLRRAARRSTVCQRQIVHLCVSLSPCPQRKMWERLVWMTIVNILYTVCCIYDYVGSCTKDVDCTR